jgi:hypothetical protein
VDQVLDNYKGVIRSHVSRSHRSGKRLKLGIIRRPRWGYNAGPKEWRGEDTKSEVGLQVSVRRKCDRHPHKHIDTVSGAPAVGDGASGVFGVLDTLSGLTKMGCESRWVRTKAQCSTRTVDGGHYGGAIVSIEKGANPGKRRAQEVS